MHTWAHRDYGRMHRACTGQSQMRNQHCEGEVDASSCPWLFTKEKLVFFNGVTLAIQTTLKGGPMPSSRWRTLNKLSGIFEDLFSHNVLFDHFFNPTSLWLSIIVPNFVFYGFYCAYSCVYFFMSPPFFKICLFSKERGEREELGMWGDGKDLERDGGWRRWNYDQNIL